MKYVLIFVLLASNLSIGKADAILQNTEIFFEPNSFSMVDVRVIEKYLPSTGHDVRSIEEGIQFEVISINRMEENFNILETDTGETSDLVLFFGRFHPIFVHLPIGFLLFAFMLEFASLFKRYELLQHAVPFALLMGILSGIAAGATGYMLSLGGGYGEDLLVYHKWFGISVIIISLAAYIIRIGWYDHPALKKIFRSILVIMVVVVMLAGHFGGSLTHGSDYLFRYMPVQLLSLSGLELEEEEQIALIEDLDRAYIYDDVISPIMRTRCESCHNPDRTEGEFLMTSFDQLMSGGESGPVIVEHNSGKSELYRRLILPTRDEERMPPRGRTQLTSDQVKLIAWWIDQGVPSTKMVSELEIADEIFDILHGMSVDGQSFFQLTEVPEPDDVLIEKLRSQGFRIAKIAEGENFLHVRTSASKTVINGEDMEMLLPLSEQITWLDFNRLEITDDNLKMLSEFKHLTRLSLSNTQITNNTLKIISKLEYLEYLNVYATDISDKGLQYVERLGNLCSIYLWQTKVSEEGVEDLRAKMPEVHINFGSMIENRSF